MYILIIDTAVCTETIMRQLALKNLQLANFFNTNNGDTYIVRNSAIPHSILGE